VKIILTLPSVYEKDEAVIYVRARVKEGMKSIPFEKMPPRSRASSSVSNHDDLREIGHAKAGRLI
jgi:hypothetical protein